MSQPPTQKEIAKIAGISRVSVSKALRGEDGVSEETRQKVIEIAKKLEYIPNPSAQELAAQRILDSHSSFKANLLVIAGQQPQEPFERFPIYAKMKRGLLKRAQQLGYSLDFIWYYDSQYKNKKRLQSIIHAKNIKGILLFDIQKDEIQINLSQLPLVCMSIGLSEESELNQISVNRHQAVQLATRKLLKQGYRRFGLAMWEGHDKGRFTFGGLNAAWANNGVSIKNQIPHFYWTERADIVNQSNVPRHFIEWTRKNRVEAILTAASSQQIIPWLAQAKIKVPQDIALIELNLTDQAGELAGTYFSPEKFGHIAIDFFVGQIFNQSHSHIQTPIRVSMPFQWIDGRSMQTK